jgi:hypothetical protein
MPDDKLTPEQISELEANLEGVSQEVADKYRAEFEALKGENKGDADPATAPADKKTEEEKKPDPAAPAASPAAPATAASPAASPAAPTATPAATGESKAEDDLAKQFPDGKVPLAALVAERRKRQELEAKLTAPAPFQAPAAPAPSPAAQPAPAQPTFDPNSRDYARMLAESAANLWQQNNPNDVFDGNNPAHVIELMKCRETAEAAFNDYREFQRYRAAKAAPKPQDPGQQRFEAEIVQPLREVYGVHYPAIEKIVGDILKSDPREKHFVVGSMREGNMQPLFDLVQKAADQYRQTLQKPVTKSPADKVDELSALPRTGMLPQGDKGKARTQADIEKMIADGSWAKLPDAERAAIIEQFGGGPIT